MLALIKWLIIIGLLGSLWLVYDVYSDMSESEQKTVREEFIKRKTNLYERAKTYVHELLD